MYLTHFGLTHYPFERALEPDELFASSVVCEAQVRLTHLVELRGIGLITGIIVQALFNISVVISLLPAKGIPLPFISYGGSSVLVTLCAVGILLNISKQPSTSRESEDPGVHRRKRRTGLR